MEDKTGGAAFPVFCDQTDRQLYGMDLRDYFAAKALLGLIAEPPYGEESTALVISLCRDIDLRTDAAGRFAHAAYKLADAMITARTK